MDSKLTVYDSTHTTLHDTAYQLIHSTHDMIHFMYHIRPIFGRHTHSGHIDHMWAHTWYVLDIVTIHLVTTCTLMSGLRQCLTQGPTLHIHLCTHTRFWVTFLHIHIHDTCIHIHIHIHKFTCCYIHMLDTYIILNIQVLIYSH